MTNKSVLSETRDDMGKNRYRTYIKHRLCLLSKNDNVFCQKIFFDKQKTNKNQDYE